MIPEQKAEALKWLIVLDGFFRLFGEGKNVDSYWSKVALSELRTLLELLPGSSINATTIDVAIDEWHTQDAEQQGDRLEEILALSTSGRKGAQKSHQKKIDKINKKYKYYQNSTGLLREILLKHFVDTDEPKSELSKDMDEVASKIAREVQEVLKGEIKLSDDDFMYAINCIFVYSERILTEWLDEHYNKPIDECLKLMDTIDDGADYLSIYNMNVIKELVSKLEAMRDIK